MKKLLFTVSILILSCASAHADKLLLYLSIGTGYTATNDSDWSGGGLSGSIIGTSFLKNTRTELEVAYKKADLNKISLNGAGSSPVTGSVETWSYLVNGYYDFMEGKPLRPYLSVGAGMASHTGKLTAVGGLGTPGADGDDTVFAYQLGAGASYAMTDKVSLWGG